ncbi:MAG: sigma factor, partial [Bacteroidales bacterium]|nr:sigma factor [Bacteroidales bacterium]
MDYTNQQTLLRGLQNGETAAFEHLRETSYHSVAYIAKSNSGSNDDAEDLYSEGIEKLLQDISVPSFVLKKKVSSFFIEICVNKNKNMFRKQKTKLKYLNEQRDDSYEEAFEERIDREVFQGIHWKSNKKLKEDCQ